MPNTDATTVEARGIFKGCFSSKFYRGDGLGGDAFAAAGKAQAFGCGGLDADPGGIEFQDLRDPGLHRVAMRPDFGPFADDGDIDMIDDAAPGRHQGRGVVEELPGRRAAPTLIGWREMLADIAFADTAEQRIGDGMQSDIGVGMTFQAVTVREFDAAQPDVIAILELVNV